MSWEKKYITPVWYYFPFFIVNKNSIKSCRQHTLLNISPKNLMYMFLWNTCNFFILTQLEKRQNTTISEKDRNERLTLPYYGYSYSRTYLAYSNNKN